MSDIHVCFATNEEYTPYCGVAISSIIKNKAYDDRLHFYVLNQKLSEDSKRKLLSLPDAHGDEIHIIDISADMVKLYEDAPIIDGVHLTVETYFRILIPQVFSNLDRILYLDSDILVRGSLAELFSMDMQGQPISLAKSWGLRNYIKDHFNAGIMLVDCKKWREENIGGRLVEILQYKKNELDNDEGLINLALRGRIHELGYKWNRQILLDSPDSDKAMENDVILHFVTVAKPWHGVCQNDLTDEYFDYLNKFSWDVEDKRDRNKNIDTHRYYEGLQSLLYMKARGMISTEDELILLLAHNPMNELMYAAWDLGFCNVRNEKLQNIPARVSKKTRIVIESDFDYDTKCVLEDLGYENGTNYSFVRRPFHIYGLKTEFLNAMRPYWEQSDIPLGIAIYGTANRAAIYTEILTGLNINIICYVDSSTEKWGGRLYGKEIISPDRLKEIARDNILVLIASAAFAEIRKGLSDRGISNEKIIVFDFI